MAVERDRLIDPVSGLWNRRGLNELFDREIARAARQHGALAVALLAIDDRGRADQAIDDAVVIQSAQLLLNAVRSTDVVARYDGETFAILMPGIYPVMVPAIGAKILQAFRHKAMTAFSETGLSLTLSAGFAVAFPRQAEAEAAVSLMAMAAGALLAARHAGGDRFEIADLSDSLLTSLALA